MIETIIISVLGVMVVILGFTTFNLLRKNEKQEDILAGYITYLDQLSRIIEISDEKLKKLMSEEYLKMMMKLVLCTNKLKNFRGFYPILGWTNYEHITPQEKEKEN